MIKKKSISDIILPLIFFLFIVLVISNQFIFPRLSTTISSKSLISKEAMKKTEKIRLAQGDPAFIIYLTKNISGWNLTVDDSHYFPVIDGLIENLLGELSIKRTLHKVGTDRGIPYGIGTANTFTISLLDAKDNLISELYFGDTDVAGKDIYISYAGDKDIIRTQNTFTNLLTVTASKWVDLSVFTKELKTNQIEEISFTGSNATKMYRASHDVQIERFSNILESLTCIDITNISAPPSEIITITFGDTRSMQISLAAFHDVWILKMKQMGFHT